MSVTVKLNFINPEIVEESGEQTGSEGCLKRTRSVRRGYRPNVVTVKAQDRNGKWFKITGKELLARAFCHEIEHLDGKLFLDRVIRFID